MRELLTFQKDAEGWFIVLPAWKGEKSALQMVSGADTLLDYLCNGKSVVNLTVSDKPFRGRKVLLILTKSNELGADYLYIEERETDHHYHELWLCPVTLFVFGEYPYKIYLKTT
jgi:hypothetical protein